MSRQRSLVVTIVVAIVAIGAGMLLARALFDNRKATDMALAKATLLTPPRPLPAFSLLDQTGAPVDAARLKQRWSLLFFGFTHCPDVCPTTLAMLAQVEKKLQTQTPDTLPQIVLVSVDPQRDTPAALASYIKFFSPTFTAMTGTVAAMDEFARAMSVPVARQDLPNGDYTVDHSAVIFLIDPSGAMRAIFSTPHEADVIAADYQSIVKAG